MCIYSGFNVKFVSACLVAHFVNATTLLNLNLHELWKARRADQGPLSSSASAPASASGPTYGHDAGPKSTAILPKRCAHAGCRPTTFRAKFVTRTRLFGDPVSCVCIGTGLLRGSRGSCARVCLRERLVEGVLVPALRLLLALLGPRGERRTGCTRLRRIQLDSSCRLTVKGDRAQVENI